MKMKKIVSILLVLLMAFSLFACNKDTDDAKDSGTPGTDAGGEVTDDANTGDDANTDDANTTDDATTDDANTDDANAGAEEDDLAAIVASGKLVIGITEYAPMNYYDESGVLVGFDTEFAQAVCEKLGIEPEFIVINWDSKELELSSKKIDCIWNGLTVTEERKENMAFSQSYLRNEQCVVIKASNADTYTDIASLAGATVVAEAGSAGQSAIEADLADATFVPVEAQSNALLEVKAGTADAAVIDITMATAMTGEGTEYSDLMIVSAIDMMDEEYAIGLRLGSSAVAKIDEIIGELLADGTIAGIAEKYDLTNLVIG